LIINLILLTKTFIGVWVGYAIPTWIWHIKYVSTIYNENKKHGKRINEEEMKKKEMKKNELKEEFEENKIRKWKKEEKEK